MTTHTDSDLDSQKPAEAAATPTGPKPGKGEEKGGRQQSIKRRVIRLVLIPSVVALVIWFVASGYLVYNGYYARAVASSVREVSIPAVNGLSSVQQERRLSIEFVSRTDTDREDLAAERRRSDAALAEMRTSADSALASAPNSIKSQWEDLSGRLDKLSQMRSAVDYRATDRQSVYEYYNGILDAATRLFDAQARVTPDTTSLQGGLTATDTFRVADKMSRAGSILSSAFSAGSLSEADYQEFTGLVGSYRAELTQLSDELRPVARSQYEQLIADEAWGKLVNAENAAISAGSWKSVPKSLTTARAAWDDATTAVSGHLVSITTSQADEVSAQAIKDGNQLLLYASLGSLAALLVAGIAIAWAVRQSNILVDRALSVRLDQLGRDAAMIVDERLPQMMERLRRREQVNTEVEIATRDYGQDEIGRLAEVLNRSLHVAVSAAVDEAATRAASTAMLMGVARRPQRPLQRGLRGVEELQNVIGDEKVLANLFDINHQLAQTRRFLENLVILAGGQTGRRFHKPVPLRRVLLAAIAETQQYQRITLRATPDLALAANVVAGTTHLLAELLDNALTFSSPQSEVFISCTQATRGVVVEIEDAGVGMAHDKLEKANDLLANAPAPDMTALRDGAQVGFWVVAELAKRHGMRVTLRTSAYGGLLVIVLLPTRMIVSGPDAPSEPDDAVEAEPWANRTSAVPPAQPAGTARRGHAEDAAHHAAPATPVAVDDSMPTAEIPAVRDGLHHRGGRKTNTATGPTSPARPQATSGRQQPAGRPALPVRRPQEHLAPQLKHEDQGAAQPQAAEQTRSPEQARNRLSQYQRGWRAGRAADDNPAPSDRDRNA